MKNGTYIILFALLFGFKPIDEPIKTPQRALTSYVNPFIGTDDANVGSKDLAANFNAGNVIPGATVPWGMVSISPHNTFEINAVGMAGKIPGGYKYGESTVCGFGQLHLSGVGCHDWGNLIVMPKIGNISTTLRDNQSKYDKESASPGYYALHLLGDDIKTEVSATTRSTITRYTFNKKSDSLKVIFDLYQNIIYAKDGYLKISSDTTIEGWILNGGFCGSPTSQKVHFYAVFNKKSNGFGSYNYNKLFPGEKMQSGPKTGGYFQFSTNPGEQLILKIGISFVSILNAKQNLETEQPASNFEKVKSAAQQAWEKELSKIKVEGKSEKDKTIFYTALYHTLIHPSTYSDVNGEYLTMKTKNVKKLSPDQKNQYTVFSLWDTYRNLHPLLTLAYPYRQLDMVKTMVDHYKEGGFLPVWEIASNESYIMVGDPAAIVISDTYMKGLKDFDIAKGYEGMLKSASLKEGNLVRKANYNYDKYGYIPIDNPGEFVWGPVATSLEYYLADWNVAQVAKSLGKETEYKKYLERSFGYRKLYDPSTGFIRPKNENGTWMTPFNPDTLRGSLGGDWPSGGKGFVEGNAWQYTFIVPHDIENYVKLVGKEKFIQKLQASFEGENRFVLFNEPDMCYPYLFDYIDGEGWRTQKQVRDAMNLYFGSTPGGLPGNDDCGTLSSWYLFSAMGFYPTCPGSTTYQIGSPLFDHITIELEPEVYKGSKTFDIVVKNNSKENIYIQKMTLNGKPFKGQSISHFDIVKGGKWVLEMGKYPKK